MTKGMTEQIETLATIKGMMNGINKPQGRKIFETVNEHLELSDESSPDLLKLSFYGIIEDAVYKLRDLLKKGKITWKEPFAQLEYDIPEKDALSSINARAIIYGYMFYLTWGVVIEDGSPGQPVSFLDADFLRNWKEMQAGRTKEDLVTGFDFLSIINSQSSSAGLPVPCLVDPKEHFSVNLRFAIRPLTLDQNRNKIFFPVHVGLDIIEGDPSAWSEDTQSKIWRGFQEAIDNLSLPLLKELKAKGAERPPLLKPDRVKPIQAGYFKAPGRLFDTPRHITGQGKTELLPEIGRWYQQAAFNRTVGMAAAALTKMDTRETILDWQSATVEEVADLVFCRSEGGTPSYGQNREDILKAFEALRAIPIPIVKIDWKRIGTGRNPRWIKEYKLRVASLLQSYGPVFVDKKTGKEVVTADPSRKKDLVKAKPDRRKSTRKLVELNPVDGILKAFPAESYTLTRFEWRWNTDIAEDFICPQVALDQKDRPRLKQIKGRHIEGSRFIMLNKQYFAVQKHLRAAGSTYGPRLLDMIVSEKKHITSRGKDAVWIEIESEKVIKWLDLWAEYQGHPKHVLEEHVAPAILALINEKVLLLESWLVPQKDKNEDRRKNPYYRWKVAELWTTVALVPSEEAKDIEDELVAQAEAEEAARSQPQPKADQAALPGIMEDALSIPSGSDIRAAREAAGLNLRRFAEVIKGGSFNTWARYERGEPIRVGSIPPDAWERVRDFIATGGKKEGKDA